MTTTAFRSNVLQYLLLLLILVVLPAGSYWYLQRGISYRRAALAQLDNLGRLTEPTVQPTYGILPDTLAGNMVVIGWLNPQETQTTAAYGHALQRLHQQFDSNQVVYFLTLLTQPDSAWTANFLREYQLEDPRQVAVAAMLPDFAAWRNQLNWPDPTGKMPQLALVTDSLRIRAYYDAGNERAMQDLVTHLAMFMPKKKERELIFRREKEK